MHSYHAPVFLTLKVSGARVECKCCSNDNNYSTIQSMSWSDDSKVNSIDFMYKNRILLESPLDELVNTKAGIDDCLKGKKISIPSN